MAIQTYFIFMDLTIDYSHTCGAVHPGKNHDQKLWDWVRKMLEMVDSSSF